MAAAPASGPVLSEAHRALQGAGGLAGGPLVARSVHTAGRLAAAELMLRGELAAEVRCAVRAALRVLFFAATPTSVASPLDCVRAQAQELAQRFSSAWRACITARIDGGSTGSKASTSSGGGASQPSGRVDRVQPFGHDAVHR